MALIMADRRELVRSVLKDVDKNFGIDKRRVLGVGPSPHYPVLESMGNALGYVLPSAGEALSTLGKGRGLSNTDRLLAASDFAGIPSGGVLTGGVKQVAARGVRRILDVPVDEGRRAAMRGAAERTGEAARAAAVPALLSMARGPSKTAWGKIPEDARKSIALGLKAAKFPADREINRHLTGRLVNMGLPNPKVNRRTALKGVAGLTAATAAIPKLSPVGRTLRLVEGAPLSTQQLQGVKGLRDAAVVRGLLEAGRKLEAPVSRRDVVKGGLGLIGARAAGL